MKGMLKNGFSYEIDDHVLDNMELLDEIAKVESNPLAISKVLYMLLGEEQRKRLYDTLRDPVHGTVPIAAVSDAITEIFGSSGQLKN